MNNTWKRRIITILLVCLLALPLAFAGGKQEESSATEGSGTTSTKKAEPKVLRLAEAFSLSLPGQSWGSDCALTPAVYDWLVVANEQGELEPELATSWDSPDGKVWTIELRKGVKFHDGSDFNAEDLIFCVERTQDPDLGHVAEQNFAVVERIEKVDDYTVTFYLSGVRPTFMYNFVGFNMYMLSSDYDYAGMGVTKPMGTGPFTPKEIIVGEGAVFVKNENYWKEGYPKVDEVRYYYVDDMETRMNMLEQGRLDVVRDMAISNLERIQNNPDLKYEVPYTYFRIVAMNVEAEPFDDPLVREAVKYSLDPEQIAKACLGTLGEDIFFSEFHIAATQKEYKDIPPRNRDISKAKDLLARAGYPDGIDVDLYYESDIDFSTQIALTMKELAAPAGIRITLNGHPRDIYLSQFWNQEDFMVTAWNPRVDPSLILELAYHSGGPWNESKLADPEADEIMDAILVEVDEQKRMALYEDLQEWFHEYGPIVNIQVPFIVAMAENVTGYSEALTRFPAIKEIDLK